MAKEKTSFIVRKKYRKQIELLDNEKAWMLFKAIMKLQDWEVLENTDPVVDMLLSIMEEERKQDNEHYQEVCEKNKENGSKGGRPKKNRTVISKTEWNPTEPKKADNDNDSDNDSDNKNKRKKNVKKKKYLDFVLLSDEEYWKLLEIFWQTKLNQAIENLNNYIWSKGKHYDSHYHTIRKRNQEFIQEVEKRKKENAKQDLPSEEWLLWTITLKR